MAQADSIQLYDQITQETIIRIQLPLADGFIIGRTDAASDYIPDIDLSPWEARKHGVSRRHAALVMYKHKLHVVDLSSANGTFVNNQRLRAETPQRLHVGDQISFGTLRLLVG